MNIYTELILHACKKGNSLRRKFPKWSVYGAGGTGMLIFVGFSKAFLLVIGMAFLLVYVWSQSTTTLR